MEDWEEVAVCHPDVRQLATYSTDSDAVVDEVDTIAVDFAVLV